MKTRAVLLCLCLLVLGGGGTVATATAATTGMAVQSATRVLTAEPDSDPLIEAVLGVSRAVEHPAGGEGAGKAPPEDRNLDFHRDDDLYVHIQQLEAWMKKEEASGKIPAGGGRVRNLVLYLNAIPLAGVHPNHYFIWPEPKAGPGTPGTDALGIYYLRFTLARTEESKAAWNRLLRKPDFHSRPMDVSVGFENGEMIPTFVTANGSRPIFFKPISLVRFGAGAFIILGSLWLFVWLAHHTDIIRDTAAPLRPDGLRPYSLARSQMAFWFYLTVAAFFLLWVLTGAMDTLNSSVLGLIGISAATALGAAFVDAAPGADGEPASVKAGRNLPAVDLSRPRRVIRGRLQQQINDAEAVLVKLEGKRENLATPDPTALPDGNATDITEAKADLEALRTQLRYFQWPAWRGVLNDLLAEKEFISFHRFQILVWSLVLGVMFVAGVYTELAMPEFNATLLGLLGISGGTYVGFKLPAAQSAPAQAGKA